eukprot:1063433-Heterocapsa_arctica.AAC.1
MFLERVAACCQPCEWCGSPTGNRRAAAAICTICDDDVTDDDLLPRLPAAAGQEGGPGLPRLPLPAAVVGAGPPAACRLTAALPAARAV